MSIATRTGDDGTTGLLFNRRVLKSDPRIEAGGCLDHLNASIGMARALNRGDTLDGKLKAVQKQLIILMGEVATLPGDLERFEKDGFLRVTPAMLAELDEHVLFFEGQKISFKGWATPGETIQSAALDIARTVCRTAERRVFALHHAGELAGTHILKYLNRLSDVLWLMARWAETNPTRERT